MAKQHVRLTSDGTANGTQILIDGKPLESVSAIAVDFRANDLVRCTFEMFVNEIEIDGEVIVAIPDPLADKISIVIPDEPKDGG